MNINYEDDDDDDMALEDDDVEKGEWDWERWKIHFVRVDEQEKIVSILQPILEKQTDTFVNFLIHNIDLSKHVKCKDPSGGSSIYELYAISNHYGGLGGNHYSAYAK
nr:ubiquitin carboxyl-terminal hydrolase 9-like [Tanacetum cinerariifolium]